MSYKNLEIWQLAKHLVIDIHKMTLSEFPKFEIVELLTRYQKPATSYQLLATSNVARNQNTLSKDFNNPADNENGL